MDGDAAGNLQCPGRVAVKARADRYAAARETLLEVSCQKGPQMQGSEATGQNDVVAWRVRRRPLQYPQCLRDVHVNPYLTESRRVL